MVAALPHPDQLTAFDGAPQILNRWRNLMNTSAHTDCHSPSGVSAARLKSSSGIQELSAGMPPVGEGSGEDDGEV